MSTRYAKPNDELTLWQNVWRGLFLPEYLFRPWCHKPKVRVIERIPRHEMGLGYYLKVEFDNYRDNQSIYPKGHMTRVGYVRVSRRLWHERFLFDDDVYCQYSRLENSGTSVRLRIAR